jgi:hypothetical protein
VVTTWWLVALVASVLLSGSFPPPEGADFGRALEGLGLFAAGWVWALVSSLALLRAARHRAPRA